MNDNNEDYNLFSGDKFVESLRSGGYKNTSYAIAELIDNGIDAEAKHIEILCQDVINHVTNRYTLDQIGIFDDGHGMNQEELRRSLLFGSGNRGMNSKEIGKYGMGLPNSSLSQCKKVEVYSWQNSSEPLYSYIDLDKVKKGDRQIPKPEIKKIPNIWKKSSEHFSKKSGTLVVWSQLDRCSWTTSKKIMEHSEYLIGRLYRKFITKDLVINMKSFGVNKEDIVNEKSRSMLPNDPLYLTTPSSTPGEWSRKPMFKPDETFEEEHPINYDGAQHVVKVRYSLVKDEVRDPKNNTGDPGSTPHGKHAQKNVGVSIIRADREIEMNTDLVISYDPTERWWGVEINLPTSLDLAVGLTNNKQHTIILSDILYLLKRFIDDDEGRSQVDDELFEQNPTRSELLIMCQKIESHIRSMRRRLKASRSGTRGGSSKPKLEDKIKGGFDSGQNVGEHGQTEEDRKKLNEAQRESMLADGLVNDGIEEEQARKIAARWIAEDKKVTFDIAELDGSQFFSVENMGGILRIKINSNHRAYKNLLSVTESNEHENLDCKKRLELARDGLWLLLTSWARFEDLTTNKDLREKIQDIRIDWGKQINRFLEQNEV